MLFPLLEKDRIKIIIKFPYNKYNRYGMVSNQKSKYRCKRIDLHERNLYRLVAGLGQKERGICNE